MTPEEIDFLLGVEHQMGKPLKLKGLHILLGKDDKTGKYVPVVNDTVKLRDGKDVYVLVKDFYKTHGIEINA